MYEKTFFTGVTVICPPPVAALSARLISNTTASEQGAVSCVTSHLNAVVFPDLTSC